MRRRPSRSVLVLAVLLAVSLLVACAGPGTSRSGPGADAGTLPGSDHVQALRVGQRP